jgi:hypothetical protein
MFCPFVAPQCRCEKSFGEDLGLETLRDSLIEPLSGNADNPTAYKLLQDWLKDPTNQDNSEDLAGWFQLYSTVRALGPFVVHIVSVVAIQWAL